MDKATTTAGKWRRSKDQEFEESGGLSEFEIKEQEEERESHAKRKSVVGKIAGVMLRATVSAKSAKARRKEMAGPAWAEYKPTLMTDHARLPEIKDKKTGDVVTLIAKGVITNIGLDRNNNRGNTEIQLDKIGVMK